MGFHVLDKHGLNKHGLKDPKLVSFGGEKNREKRKGEEGRRRRASKAKLQKGMELHGFLKL